MLQRIFSAGLVLGFLTMIFYTPAIMAKGILQLDSDDLSTKDKVLCKIPIVNIAIAEKVYTGRISTIAISTIAVLAMIAIRIAVVFLLPSVFVVQVITVILFLLSLISFFITNMVFVFRVMNDADTRELTGKLLYSIVFPLGQFYIGTYLPTEMKNLAKQEEVFK